MYEFSDFPMDTETYGLKPEQHIPGTIIHRYLTNYAEKFGFYKKIQFNTKVETAEHRDGGGWIITVTPSGGHSPASDKSQVLAAKLIVATGLTSDPFLPKIPDSEKFGAPIFHSKNMLEHAPMLENAESTCILGCTKSGWDAVYACVAAGNQVDWIIRESGHGPVWMSPPKVTPLKQFLEKLVLTRILSWFSPCIWGSMDGYPRIRQFLHGTWMGRFFVDKFWSVLRGDLVTLNQYSAHLETKKLQPWTSPMFIGAGLSILNYDKNIFEFVRNGTVRVHVADITRLSSKTVHLSNGDEILTSALICSTGWKHNPPLKFLPTGVDYGTPDQSETWALPQPAALVNRADEDIFLQLPRLKDQPLPNPKFKPLSEVSDVPLKDKTESFKLYRYIVPPKLIDSHDLAFAGSMLSISTSICAQIQALWITAYFHNEVPVSSDVEYETALYNRYAKWRTPVGFGARFPDFAFDSLPYYDMLLRDLGLNPHRKRGAIANIFHSHGPQDYSGLVDEWMTKRLHPNLSQDTGLSKRPTDFTTI